MDKMVLKLTKKYNPNLDIEQYRKALTPMELDMSIVDLIYDKIKPTPKNADSEIVFTAAILLLFSPKAILLSEKSEYGVAQIIQKKLCLKRHQQSSYRIKTSREVYQVDKVFKHKVNEIVKEVKDE